MAVESNQQVVTIREVNKSLLSILGSFFGIGITIGTMYVMSNNTKMDSIIDVQNQTNLKIESFSVKTELNDLKLMKLESRADAFATRQNEFDKDLSQSNMILKNHDQLLHKHEAQIKALEK
ncbi:hypothetical protein [Wohlfahrtiimonas larvae]|uniref:Uncharacterized protein n=1 Tax=Wohlfahrtiimonas larvae TaxID=1157986 RepID=A0ABP9MNX1_9GAMM